MDLPNPQIELGSIALQADSLPTVLSGKPKIVTKKDEAIKEVTMIFKIARSNYSVQTAVLGKKTVKKKKKKKNEEVIQYPVVNYFGGILMRMKKLYFWYMWWLSV